MSESVLFNPERTCNCLLSRQGYAGCIFHRPPCEKEGAELLTQSGQTIVVGKKYRWVQGDDQWSRDRGYPYINVVAQVTQISDDGLVIAYWDKDRPESDERDQKTGIPNSAILEMVEE